MSAGSSSNPRHAPWVIVAGGFHRFGGMDKANLALAEYLIARGTPVHLVCHQMDAELARHALVTVHHVPRPAGSIFLGEPLLDLCGRRVARQITKRWAEARVVVNGGNCVWPGINWVHCVHHEWKAPSRSGPAWFRVKQMLTSSRNRRRERRAFERAQLLVANSNLTARHLQAHFDIETTPIRTIYLGAEPEWGPITSEERISSRNALGLPLGLPIAIFVGALGYEHNKGFDVLFESWKRLCAQAEWDANLLVAGGGTALEMWRRKVAESGLDRRIRFFGFSHQLKELLAAADILVSPVRYEAYGLNVQEAICRGLPALVSANAGIAERYPQDLKDMLLPDPENVSDLAARLLSWRAERNAWKEQFRPFSDALREQTWRRMAEQFISIADDMECAPESEPLVVSREGITG